ncbi:unnamed protein product, partial [Prorocentrum cordatum]
ARKFLCDCQGKHQRASVMGNSETHLLPEKQQKIAVDLGRDGCKRTATAARPPCLRETGCRGGEMLIARRRLETTSFDHVRAAAQPRGRGDPSRGFAATTVQAKELASLAASPRAEDDPWIAAADWKLDLEAMLKSEFPQKTGGVAKTPKGAKATGSEGEPGSLLDSCLVRKDVAREARCALRIALKGPYQKRWARARAAPGAPPRTQRPKKRADPNKKTSRVKQKRLQERRQRLPPEEREAFVQPREEERVCQEPGGPFLAPLECWRRADEQPAQTAQRPGDRVVYQGREQQEKDFSHRYRNWTSKPEPALLATHEVEVSEKARHLARRAHMKCRESDTMCYALTLMQKYQTLARGWRDEVQRGRVICEPKRIAIETLDQGVADFPGSARLMVWQKMMKVEALSPVHRQRLLEPTGLPAAAGQARATGGRAGVDSKLVKDMRGDKMGALRKHAKGEPAIINDICAATSTTAIQKTSLEDIQAQLQKTSGGAQEEDYPPIEQEEFDRALNAINGGAGASSSTEAQCLPHVIREGLRQLMNDTELNAVWPRQCTAAVAASVPKPAGGDRVLGMIALLPKIWSKARGSIVNNSLVGGARIFWGGDLRGCPALRAALHRALLDEVGGEMQLASAALLLDLLTFCDVISLAPLVELAMQAKYPAVAVAMEVEIFLGPRILQDQRHGISDWVRPTRSAVAGSARGAPMAEMFIRAVLDKAHLVAPQERGQIISNETRLLASDARLGQELQAELVSLARPLQPALDAPGGRRRSGWQARDCKKQRKRTLAAGMRAGRIARTRRGAALAEEAKGLWGTGPGLEEDPGVKPRLQLAGSWLEPREAAPEARARIKRDWPAIRGALLTASAGRRWHRARGPVGTPLATPMDAGWGARAASAWSRPEVDGATTKWHLAGSSLEAHGSFIDRLPILHDLREDIRRQLWKQAKAHEDGITLESGADALRARRELDQIARRGMWAEWSRAMAVICGRQWSRARKRRCGHAVSAVCPRCGLEPETLTHGMWQRTANVSKGSEFAKSEHLVARRLREVV